MSGSETLSWNDAHFCGLRSQTNVYCLSKIVSKNNRIKALAASIDGQLASIEFDCQSAVDNQIPISSDDVLFDSVLDANNPNSEGENEIVSIDIICNWDHQGKNVFAVTYLKLCHYEEDKAPKAFMNIYQLSGEDKNNLNVSSSLIQNLSLEFTPFKLTHHKISVMDGREETFILLSGNDHKVHVYEPMKGYKGFQEIETSNFFPELAKIDDCVTQVEIKQLDDLYRLTVFGTQNGLILLFLVNRESRDILDSWTSEMDSPITSLNFFHQHTNIPCPDFLKRNDTDGHSNEEEEEALNLLVTSAVDPAVVYNDVVANGLSKCRLLPVSNSQDVILCSCVMDIDFDGENEVLIGTYGKVLLVYKLIYEKPQVYSSTPFHSPFPVPIHTDTPILSNEGDKPVKPDSAECKDKDKDIRRRHKTVAVTTSTDCESSLLIDRIDEHKSDDICLPDGTSQQALMLRLVRSQENLASPSTRSIQFETPDKMLTPDLTVPQFATIPPGMDFPCYKLIWTRRFCNPVMGLACDDMTNDGILDLVVLTLKGLHVLQPDLEKVSTIILNRLQMLCNKDGETDPSCHKTADED